MNSCNLVCDVILGQGCLSWQKVLSFVNIIPISSFMVVRFNQVLRAD